MRFALAFVGAAFVLSLLITAIEVIDICRYRAEVPPVNIEAKYRLGPYAPLEPPAPNPFPDGIPYAVRP
ncbi:MAG TPA: hypothetical protein VFD75_16635 [Pyrinomonadaceae bacterium]|jgi:hypothetical protein|nr:hypothetical protein [Pyrinomonadaceae bacterium]